MKKNIKKKILVTKYSGEAQAYSESKLRASLKRAGAPAATINKVIQEIQKELFPGITTKRLYQKAFQILRKESRHFAARYGLKKAIMKLGPDGFPFEKFVSAILDELGYKTKTNIILNGRCISHEIDVIASLKDKKTLVECKFHNQQGLKTNSKITLYVSARARDLDAVPGSKNLTDFYLITNTSFTSEAIKFGECIGLKMLGWNYPKENSFKDVLEKTHLHPVTCLTSLNGGQKKRLIMKNVLLCRDISMNHTSLNFLRLKKGQADRVKEEVSHLMKV